MSQVQKRGPTSPEMNMTPLIDVTFQLIIFFMLVNNIIAEESVEMIVPKLVDPKVIELGEENRVTVNIAPEPYETDQRLGPGKKPWEWNGEAWEVKVGMEVYPLENIDQVTDTLKELKEKNPDVRVLLRADGALFYQSVQPIMGAITQANIETMHLVAYMPQEGPNIKVE